MKIVHLHLIFTEERHAQDGSRRRQGRGPSLVDKGKRGEVLRVYPEKVVVEGVAIAKRHVSFSNAANQQEGGIVEAAAIDASNVALSTLRPTSQPVLAT